MGQKDEVQNENAEMKADEESNEQEKDEAIEEMDETEQAMDVDEQQENTNEDVLGVEGGMGDTAPINECDKDDADVEMEEEQKENDNAKEKQMNSDIYGDDEEQMMKPDESMGEWKPMNEKNQRPKQDKEQKQKEKKMKNPFESLSDALTEWKQRLDVIERDETAQREEWKPMNEKNQRPNQDKEQKQNEKQ